jgi:hypothetical protein
VEIAAEQAVLKKLAERPLLEFDPWKNLPLGRILDMELDDVCRTKLGRMSIKGRRQIAA